VDKNTTVVFPAPLMSTIGELDAFLAREAAAPAPVTVSPEIPSLAALAPSNGSSEVAEPSN
jgi:hypothetical protein